MEILRAHLADFATGDSVAAQLVLGHGLHLPLQDGESWSHRDHLVLPNMAAS